MHIRYEIAVSGETLPEIIDGATKMWRDFINDPAAELAWNAEVDVTDTSVETSLDGAVVRRRYTATVRVTTDQHHAHAPVAAVPSTA